MLSSELRGLRFFDFRSDYIHLPSPPPQKSNFSWRTLKKNWTPLFRSDHLDLFIPTPPQNWNSHGEQISDLISPVPPLEFKLFMENLDFRSNHLDLPPDLQNRSLNLPHPSHHHKFKLLMENFDIEETALRTGRLTSRLILEIVLRKIKGITLEIFV